MKETDFHDVGRQIGFTLYQNSAVAKAEVNSHCCLSQQLLL